MPKKQGEFDGMWPQYVGLSGYVAGTVPSGHDRAPPKAPWSAPEIVQIGPEKWGPDPKAGVPHKTPVRVIEQDIQHPRKFIYAGTLIVEVLNTPGRRIRISMDSFTPVAYWECGAQALSADYTRAALAHVAGASVKGVDQDGKWVDVKRGTPLLCGGAAHSGTTKPGNTLQKISADELYCLTYQKGRYGSGGEPLLFKFVDIEVDY